MLQRRFPVKHRDFKESYFSSATCDIRYTLMSEMQSVYDDLKLNLHVRQLIMCTKRIEHSDSNSRVAGTQPSPDLASAK